MNDSLLRWCDDVHQVRGNISQLQATLNQVVTKTPTVAQYKELMRTYGDDAAKMAHSLQPNSLEDKLRLSLQSPQVKVAVRLKTLYDQGRLPLLQTFAAINFKLSRADRQVGYFLDYNPKRAKIDLKDTDSDTNATATAAEDTGDCALYPPLLPPLDDTSLLRLVLTDKSMRQPSDFLQLDEIGDFNNNHNRKLARHGAALVNCALVDLLDDMFPKAHELDLQYLQFRLSSPHVLAKLAYTYNLADAVQLHVSVELPVADKIQIFRTVFLAYVGAMSRSNYLFAEIKAWLAKLYLPLVSKLATDCRADNKLRDVFEIAYAEFQFMMARANNYFENPTKKVRYDFVEVANDPPVYELHVGDLVLASGTGSTVLAAKHKAAYNTFEDGELRTKLLAHILEHFREPEKLEGQAVKGPEGVPEKKPEGEPEKEPEREPVREPVVEMQTDARPEVNQPDVLNVDVQDSSEDEAYSPEMLGDFSTQVSPQPQPPQLGVHGSDQPQALPQAHASQQVAQPLAALPQVSASAPAPGQAPGQIPASGQFAQGMPTGNWAPPRGAPTSAAPRMPLPYGMLPPIPNMKKRGGEKRR